MKEWTWIAFDLDGTLYTSEPILFELYSEAIEAYNENNQTDFRIPPADEIFRWVGYPVKKIFQMLFPESTEDERAALSAWILERLVGSIRSGGGELLPGVHETLAELKEKGVIMYVVTNGRRAYLDAVIEGFQLAPFFNHLYSIEDGAFEDKGDILQSLLDDEKREW